MSGRLWHWGMGEMLSHPGLAFWLITWKICSSERLIFKTYIVLITTLLSIISDKVIDLKNKIYQVCLFNFSKELKIPNTFLAISSWKTLFTRCYHLNISIVKWRREEILLNFLTTTFQKALLQSIPHLSWGHVLFIKICLKMHYIGFI